MAENSGLEDTLTKGKVGGIPVWALGTGLAAVFIVIMYLRNRNKTAATPSPEPTDNAGTDQAGQNDTNAIDDWLQQHPDSSAYPVGLPAQGIPAPITNAQWSRLVTDELLAKGDDPTLVIRALGKFLSGVPTDTLSPAEKAVVDKALQIFGAPPEPITAATPPITITDPTPTTPVTPVTPRTAFTKSVSAGEHVDQFAHEVDAQVGHSVNWASLEAANPSLAGNINWGPSGSKDTSIRTFKRSASYTIPAWV